MSVGGTRVPVETKPLELLRELLLHAGNLVSKEDLLNAIWPDVIVVEASLPTAVHKLRAALNDDRRATHIIETVPRIGYRLAVPVKVEEPAGSAFGPDLVPPRGVHDDGQTPAAKGAMIRRRLAGLAISLSLVVALGATALALTSSRDAPAAPAPVSLSLQDAENAIRQLDVDTIERMLAAGWNPDMPFDGEGNGAINYLLNMCEWDHHHDRRRMLLMVRTLVEGGANITRRNVWGDTAYSIASAPRYCGPDHPVTAMLRVACFSGANPLGDRCLASYTLARRERRTATARRAPGAT